MKTIFSKLISVPTGETKQVQVAKTWCVRWRARDGSFHGDTKEVAEFFFNEEDATAFVQSLISAAKLLKYTAKEINITLTEENH